MKNFQLRRFALLTRQDLLSNYRSLLSMSLGFILAYILFMFLALYGTPSPADLSAEPGLWERVAASRVRDMAGGCFGIFVVFIYVIAALTFSNMPTKQARTAYLTLPATNLEKYASRLLQAVVIFPLMALLAFVVADVLRMLLFMLMGKNLPCGIGPFFSLVWDVLVQSLRLLVGASNSGTSGHTTGEVVTIGLTVWGTMLSVHAFFVLGASLVRRRAAFIVPAVFVLLSIVLGFAVVSFTSHNISLGFESSRLPTVWMAVVLWLMTIVFYVLSYKAFCRIPVIRRSLFRI